MTKTSEIQDISGHIFRSFMTEKLQFAPSSLVFSMKFSNVPRCTDANNISNSASKRPTPVVVKSRIMKNKVEVL